MLDPSTGITTTTTDYIGSLEEVTSSDAPGSTPTTTAYYGGGLVESVNGVLSYLLSDPTLGSASVSVNLSGLVTASQLYSPYGSLRYQSGILPTDYGFTHQRSDAATGLDDYGARDYDPVAGQFTSADTTLAGGLNRYAYVAGNPESATDPSGHEYRLDDDGVGGGIDGGQTSGNSGGGGGSGDTTTASSGDPTTDPVISQVSVGHDDTEYTYTGTGDSFITDDEGDVVGVVDETGQVETNAEIEAQQLADENDRVSQGDQFQRGDGQNNSNPGNSPDGSTTTPADSVHQAENARTENGTTSHAAGAVTTIDGTTISATSGPPTTSDVGIGDGSTCAECHLGQAVTTQFPQGPDGERSLEGQTIYVGVSQVSGQPPCPICQAMFGDLEDYTGAKFIVWSAARVVPRGPIVGTNGPFSDWP